MLLIGNGRVCTRDESAPWLEDGGVLIDGEVIREVGPLAELRSRYPQAQFIDAKGGIIMPGSSTPTPTSTPGWPGDCPSGTTTPPTSWRCWWAPGGTSTAT